MYKNDIEESVCNFKVFAVVAYELYMYINIIHDANNNFYIVCLCFS